jgi:hypothetical protein
MRKLISFFLFFMIFPLSGLACNLAAANLDPTYVRLESLEVTPAEGNGAFTATMHVYAHSAEDELICYAVKADHTSTTVYQKKLAPAADTNLSFSFQNTVPGDYTLYCTPQHLSISEKATFKVLDLPPSEPVLPPAGSVSPKKVNGTGQMVEDPDQYQCGVKQTILLTIRADGSAVLDSSGPNIVDHINCTPTAGMIETWSISGTVDPLTETVTFSSCNSGGFSASGAVKYAGDILAGSLTCSYIKGSSSGKIAMRLTIP